MAVGVRPPKNAPNKQGGKNKGVGQARLAIRDSSSNGDKKEMRASNTMLFLNKQKEKVIRVGVFINGFEDVMYIPKYTEPVI